MEIKINITKDKVKDQYYEMQNEKSMIAIIYTNKFDIVIYDATRNETKHQHLEKDI